MLIHDGRKVLGVRPANIGRRLDVGTFEDYFLAFTEPSPAADHIAAGHIAAARACHVDKPRNPAKTVTVE